jgi:hypothetical protein
MSSKMNCFSRPRRRQLSPEPPVELAAEDKSKIKEFVPEISGAFLFD